LAPLLRPLGSAHARRGSIARQEQVLRAQVPLPPIGAAGHVSLAYRIRHRMTLPLVNRCARPAQQASTRQPLPRRRATSCAPRVPSVPSPPAPGSAAVRHGAHAPRARARALRAVRPRTACVPRAPWARHSRRPTTVRYAVWCVHPARRVSIFQPLPRRPAILSAQLVRRAALQHHGDSVHALHGRHVQPPLALGNLLLARLPATVCARRAAFTMRRRVACACAAPRAQERLRLVLGAHRARRTRAAAQARWRWAVGHICASRSHSLAGTSSTSSTATPVSRAPSAHISPPSTLWGSRGQAAALRARLARWLWAQSRVSRTLWALRLQQRLAVRALSVLHGARTTVAKKQLCSLLRAQAASTKRWCSARLCLPHTRATTAPLSAHTATAQRNARRALPNSWPTRQGQGVSACCPLGRVVEAVPREQATATPAVPNATLAALRVLLARSPSRFSRGVMLARFTSTQPTSYRSTSPTCGAAVSPLAAGSIGLMAIPLRSSTRVSGSTPPPTSRWVA
jgi:hypothetical protein